MLPMPKIVAAKTMQLSVRIDDEDRKRMDQIRSHLKKLSRSLNYQPSMSDVARQAMSFGIRALCKDHGIKYIPTPVVEPIRKAEKAKKEKAKKPTAKKAAASSPKPKKTASSKPKKVPASPKSKRSAKSPAPTAPPAPAAPSPEPAASAA